MNWEIWETEKFQNIFGHWKTDIAEHGTLIVQDKTADYRRFTYQYCVDFLKEINFAWLGDQRGYFIREIGGCFRKYEFRNINNYIREFLLRFKIYAVKTDYDMVRSMLADQVNYKVEEFDKNPYIINFKNGYLDIRGNDPCFYNFEDLNQLATESMIDNVEFTLEPNLSFIQIPHNFSPFIKEEFFNEISCQMDEYIKEPDIPEIFDSYLDTIFQKEKDKDVWKQLIYEMIGYFILPANIFKIGFIFFSREPDTMKSSLTNILVNILGKDNCSKIMLSEISSNRFATSDMVGKLMNYYTDLPKRMVKDQGIIKDILSERELAFEVKFGDKGKYRNVTRQCFSCNGLPPVEGIDLAFARRWIIIPFRYSIPRENQVPNWEYDNIINNQAEMERVIKYSVYKLMELLQRGQFSSTHEDQATHTLDFWLAETNVVYRFINECCEKGIECKQKQSELYHRFTEYQNFDGDTRAISQNIFTTELKRLGYPVKQVFDEESKHIKVYAGIQFADFPERFENLKVDNIAADEKPKKKKNPQKDLSRWG